MTKSISVVAVMTTIGSMMIGAAGCSYYLLRQEDYSEHSKDRDTNTGNVNKQNTEHVPYSLKHPVISKDKKLAGSEIDFILQSDIDKNTAEVLNSLKNDIVHCNFVSRAQSIQTVTNILIDNMEGGFHSTAYDDGAGIMTIGFGSTMIRDLSSGKMRKVKRGDVISKKEAIRLRAKTIAENYTLLLREVPSAVLDKMSVYSIASLNSYIYNIGQSAFLKSEVLAMMKSSMKIDPILLKKFKNSFTTASGKTMNGLITRRKVESKLLGLSSKIKKTELVRFLVMERVEAIAIE